MRRNLHVRADRKLLTAGGASRRWLRVDVVAPRSAPRIPLSLGLVLDRSGSMDGEKLALAREGAIRAVRSLGEEDRLSVLVYDHAIDVLVPSRPADEEVKLAAEQLLRTVEARGNTNLSGGWLRGCEQVGLGLGEGRLGRCLLLSDGLANLGITDAGAILRHVQELRARGVTTSTLGVGRDFDEHLLRRMAEAGGGNFYFAESARQLSDFIAGETGEALRTVARGALLVVDMPEGASVASVNPFPMRAEACRSVLELGSLVADQVLTLILCVEFPRGREGEVATVHCSLWDEAEVLDRTGVEERFTYARSEESAAQPRDHDVALDAATAYAEHARQKAAGLGREGNHGEGRAVLQSMAERLRQYAGRDRDILDVAEGLEKEAAMLERLSRLDYKRLEYSTSLSLTSRGPDGMTLGTTGFLAGRTLQMMMRAESHGTVEAPFLVTAVTSDREATRLAESAGRALSSGSPSGFGYTVVDGAARVLDPGRGVLVTLDDEQGLAYALGAQGNGVKIAFVRGVLDDGAPAHWHGSEKVAIVSLDGWDDTDERARAFVAYQMALESSRHGRPAWDPAAAMHADARGCWGDAGASRDDVVAKLRAGELCAECRRRYEDAGIDVEAFLCFVAIVRRIAGRDAGARGGASLTSSVIGIPSRRCNEESVRATIRAVARLERVSLGLRAHSGWAVLVALGGPASAPFVVDRRRLSLCDGSFPCQPYHAAENLSAAKAEALVGRSLETARRLGREEVAAAVKDREAAGQRIVGAGLLLGSGRPLPSPLAAILASHPLIHTAEGEMYRDVLRAACERAGIEVTRLRERGMDEAAGPRLKLTAGALRARLAALGKPLGPPWTADHKLAALAAWLVLQDAERGSTTPTPTPRPPG